MAPSCRASSGDALGEEDPDVPTLARTGTLQCRRDAPDAAYLEVGDSVARPALAVEVGGEKAAGLVR